MAHEALPATTPEAHRLRVRVIRLDPEARDAFLADTRLGVLCMVCASGAPAGVPLWYGWNGVRIEMFSAGGSLKVRRLERDPRASLLVANVAPEPARWVSLEGRIAIHSEQGQPAAERLVRRYLRHAPETEKQRMLRALQKLDLVQLSLEPERIRSYAEID